MRTDEQLVEDARQGSGLAFDQLVSRYRDKLLRFLLFRCASHADAEDAIQDTFVNAYRYLDSFNPRWRFSTWLYRIAIRNASRQPVSGVLPEVELIDNDDPLQQCLVEGERENLWLTARKLLTPQVFMAMWLHYAEDMTMKEVSRALGRSTSWTKVSILRARRRIAKELRSASVAEAGSRNYG